MAWWSFFIKLLPIIISLIALGISIFNALRDSRAARFDLDFDLVKWFGSSDREDIPDHLWLTITNNSKLPCSILEISIAAEYPDGNVIKGTGRGNKALISTSITRTNGNEIRKEIHSLDYPQNINGYSSLGGYFHIYSSHSFYNFEERNVKVTLKTNRGSFTKNIFFDMGKNVFRVLQNNDSRQSPQITRREDGTEIVYINDGI